jgi:hypothetical protein
MSNSIRSPYFVQGAVIYFVKPVPNTIYKFSRGLPHREQWLPTLKGEGDIRKFLDFSVSRGYQSSQLT